MKSNIYSKILGILLPAAILPVVFSCRDDINLYNGIEVIEGEPATVSLSVSIPEMEVKTRAAGITPEGADSVHARTITDIWVGIYNLNTGTLVGSASSDGLLQTGEESGPESLYGTVEFKRIPALSGNSVIVAVANSKGNPGVFIDESGNSVETDNLWKILNDKERVGKLEDFKKLSAALVSPNEVGRVASERFVMSGVYTDDPSHPVKYAEVRINPEENNLTGRIHLRRLDSYFKIHIKPGDHINFTPKSWQICNIPGTSFLLERGGYWDGENIHSVNASDYANNNQIWGNNITRDEGTEIEGIAEDANQSLYHNSLVYGTSYIFREYGGDMPEGFKPENAHEFNAIDIGSYYFDFYQMENKHIGILDKNLEKSDAAYQKREQEYKSGDGLNTGWYSSLVNDAPNNQATPSADKTYMNNNASFIVLKGDIEYYYTETTDAEGNTTYEVVPKGTADAQLKRVASATYTVHLGYLDKNANDFNVNRNTTYEYTLTINGVDKIRVEASSDQEDQPGAEGEVTDVENEYINVDCHYGVANIELSDRERMNLIWRIQAPFDNQVIDLIGGNGNFTKLITKAKGGFINVDEKGNETIKEALPKNQFYNWIQIRPASGKKAPNGNPYTAHYPGDPRLIDREIGGDADYDTTADNGTNRHIHHAASDPENPDPDGVWFLEDLRDPVRFPHDGDNVVNAVPYADLAPGYKPTTYFAYLKAYPRDENGQLKELGKDDPYYNETFEKQMNTQKTYTVFIDEYVYEYKFPGKSGSMTGDLVLSDEALSDHWPKYVNKDNRKVWLSLQAPEISTDIESIYAKSLYIINQESIQTYYSDAADEGIGIEITNESFRTGSKNLHGEWNEEYNGLEKPGNGDLTLAWKNARDNAYSRVDGRLNQWNYIQYNNYYYKNWGAIPWKYLMSDIRNNPDNNIYFSSEFTFRNDFVTHEGFVFSEPSNAYVLNHESHPMEQCMARNRDLNNNGIIEPNEVRWYLPTQATYSRIILGGAALRKPLFNCREYPQGSAGNPTIHAGTGAYYSHYVGSDRTIIWAEELGATGDLQNTSVAGTVRCIRNIGRNTNKTPSDRDTEGYSKVLQAYKHDAEKNTVELYLYRDEVVRPATSGHIPTHYVGDIRSFPARRFKYAAEDCMTSNLTGKLKGEIIPAEDGHLQRIGDEGTPENFPADWLKNGGWLNDWIDSVDANGICGAYSENGETGWRLPNISELAAMFLIARDDPDVEILNPNYRYYSCSREYFSAPKAPEDFQKNTQVNEGGWSRFMGVNGENITAWPPASGVTHVRCVKDL